jgi:hypothetical protein
VLDGLDSVDLEQAEAVVGIDVLAEVAATLKPTFEDMQLLLPDELTTE